VDGHGPAWYGQVVRCIDGVTCVTLDSKSMDTESVSCPIAATERSEKAMAEATTTRPTRTRKAPASTAAKAAPPAKSEAENVTRFKVELENTGDTKSYTKFAVPADLKGTVVGSIYAPLGTKRVAIMVIGHDDNGDD
jgi:hypothetical protein